MRILSDEKPLKRQKNIKSANFSANREMVSVVHLSASSSCTASGGVLAESNLQLNEKL
jgi:hypothetical protein